MPLDEITEDWTKIPTAALANADCIAHLDPKGFRYYIPALMLRLVDSYERGSPVTIATLSALYPKRTGSSRYSLLSSTQIEVIATFMEALPNLVDLFGEDEKVVQRAFRNYWSKRLT